MGAVDTRGGRGGPGGYDGGMSGQSQAPGEIGRGPGGGGAGGAVRILAPAISGNGEIRVAGGAGACRGYNHGGGNGGVGHISLEPISAGSFSLSTLPALRISRVGGVDVPEHPNGVDDVRLPDTVLNPVKVEVAASGIPPGAVVRLTLHAGDSISGVDTSPLAGSLEASGACASLDIPLGPTRLLASTTYTISLAMGKALSRYAGGEQVERVRLSTPMGGVALALSARGDRLYVLTARNDKVTVVDIGRGTVVDQWRTGPAPVALVLSADGGELVVAHADGTLHGLGTADGKPRRTLALHLPAGHLALGLEGLRLMVAARGVLLHRDAATWQELRRVELARDILGLAWWGHGAPWPSPGTGTA